MLHFPTPMVHFPTPMVDFPTPTPMVYPKKTSTSQIDSHQNSVQNAPIGVFTALTATIFVTISVFMSQGNS